MKYFVVLIILVMFSVITINDVFAESPLILSKVEMWGPSSFIVNNVNFCYDNNPGQLGPWAVGWIEIQNTRDKTITAENITISAGALHSIMSMTLKSKESCLFQTEDQITTRIGPGGSGGNGPPHGHDGSEVIFTYVVDENGKKIQHVDSTPRISDVFGDTRIWQLVNDEWLFNESSFDNVLELDGGSFSPDRTVYPIPWERSPLQQFKTEIPFADIECKENLVLIQKYDGNPACVKPLTIPKLIERGWVSNEFLESIMNTFTLDTEKGIFEIQYFITGAELLDISSDVDINSVVITLDKSKMGHLTIALPKPLANLILGYCDKNYNKNVDPTFFILVDGKEVEFNIMTSDQEQILIIPFQEDTRKIEITVGCLI